jgi:hypothetical protein
MHGSFTVRTAGVLRLFLPDVLGEVEENSGTSSERKLGNTQPAFVWLTEKHKVQLGDHELARGTEGNVRCYSPCNIPPTRLCDP